MFTPTQIMYIALFILALVVAMLTWIVTDRVRRSLRLREALRFVQHDPEWPLPRARAPRSAFGGPVGTGHLQSPPTPPARPIGFGIGGRID